jgi:SnoaL-like protein
MSKHVAISPEEAADRLAIRELVDAYAHCADRRDAQGQMSLFTTDTHFVVYMTRKTRRRHRNCTVARHLLRFSLT